LINVSVSHTTNIPRSSERPCPYSPLLRPIEIRLVIFDSGRFLTTETNILQTNPTRKQPLEASSNSWGDQRAFPRIVVLRLRRCILYITKNLEAALQHLRETRKSVLRLDALYISQGDVEARCLQVW